MRLGLVVETNDPEKVWNGFRLANTALDAGHTVEVFLLGDGVEAPDLSHEAFNPRGVVRKYRNEGGALYACGTCMDSRGIDPGELRPESTMGTLLGVIEDADETITIG